MLLQTIRDLQSTRLTFLGIMKSTEVVAECGIGHSITETHLPPLTRMLMDH